MELPGESRIKASVAYVGMIAQVPADPSIRRGPMKIYRKVIVRTSSEKEEELMKNLTDRNMPLPNFSAHFFKSSLEIPLLPGDNPKGSRS